MRIRKKQMEALAKVTLVHFIDEALAFLPLVEPERAAALDSQGQGGLRKWTVLHVDRAFERGLTAEISILRFLEIALAHGTDYAESGGTLTTIVNQDCLDDWATTRVVLDAVAAGGAEPPPASAEALDPSL